MKKRIDIFDRLDASRGKLPDFLRGYWMIYWIIPWSLLFALSLFSNAASVAFWLWPLVSISLIIIRFFDIFVYRGTTFFGYPAGERHFWRYFFIAWIPTIAGELFTFLAH